jgi:hypothetical protein
MSRLHVVGEKERDHHLLGARSGSDRGSEREDDERYRREAHLIEDYPG